MAKRRDKQDQAEVQRELTRKEQRLRHRDRERHKVLYTFVGIALGLALALVVVGIGYQFLFKPNTTAASVGDVSIKTSDFWKRIKYERSTLENQLARLQQMEEQFGGQGFFTTQISQLQSTLSSSFALGSQTIDRMIEEIVVSQEAEQRGITVSDEEVQEALREEVANSQGLVTAPQATATAEAAVNATATASAWTPTPTPPVDASASMTPTATPLPEPSPAAVITDATYSAGESTLQQNLQQISGMSLNEYKQIIRARLLRERLAEVIGKEEVASTEEQVHARHILLNVDESDLAATDGLTGTQELTETQELTAAQEVTGAAQLTARQEVTVTQEPTSVLAAGGTIPPLEVGGTIPPVPAPTAGPRDDAQALQLAEELRSRLLAGEDFAALAAEYSDDTSSAANGGDLGWFGRGRMVAPFEEAAFSLPVGQLSDPVKTDFGYHLIEVLEKDPERSKEEQQLAQERSQAFQQWLQTQLASDQVQRPANLNDLLPTGF